MQSHRATAVVHPVTQHQAGCIAHNIQSTSTKLYVTAFCCHDDGINNTQSSHNNHAINYPHPHCD